MKKTTVTFSWNEVVKWNQDPVIYIWFVGDRTVWFAGARKGLQGSGDDLRQPADACNRMRNQEQKTASSKSDKRALLLV